jgi:Tol biopolymer transport system component/serine/threonine protein kinase
MTSESWEDVFVVFDAALATSGVERDQFLARECGGNARFRDKVESLLAAHRDAEGFLSGGRLSSAAGILAAGTRIGAFEIESFAGAGGMGEVYRARDTRLDRQVALKILSPDGATDSRGRARFACEARAIARLSHPYICALHDLGHDDGIDFLVMEYLDGETLASRLRRGPLPVAEAMRLGIQIAEALDAAHAEGIVHRDLKPANIMLVNGGSTRDGEPQAKLLDFGLARFQPAPRIANSGAPAADQPEVAGRGVIAGTPQYMAPEQVRGEEADPRSDIFSFGCVLYEMLSGHGAFGRGTAEDVMSAILRTDPPALPIAPSRSGGGTALVSRRLENTIRRCLEKVPAQRFSRMQEVRVELQAVARAVAATTRERRSRRRAAVAAVAMIAIGVVGGLRMRTRPSPLPPSAGTKVVQLTSLNGLEIAPTFSPDGTQVAFSWNGEREDNYDIYVKTVGSSDERRLTTDPAADTLPVWSPDGRQIAFLRDHPNGGTIVHAVLPTGREERKLSDFRIGGGVSARIAWSPDARWIVGRPDLTEDVAKSGSWALYLIPIGNGTPRRLTEAKGPDIDLGPAFSPDGRRLAYAACVNLSRRICGVNVIDLGADYSPAGLPRRVANAGQHVRAVAWSRDGASIVYDTNARGRWELWRVSLDGDAEPERLEVPGDHSRQPAIAPAGDRLAFERASQVLSVFKLRAKGEPEPVLVSSAWDYNPQFSPDGRRIVFSSRRSGDVEEVWLASADGSGARQLTHGPGTRQALPAWSPDGRQVAFESTGANARSDIWIIPADGGVPRRVTTDPGDESAPVWSRDGKRIYFLSDRGGDGIWGGHDTWQIPAEGGSSTRVTQGGSSPVVFESADGKALIYQSRIQYESADGKTFSTLGDSPLLAVPIGGGTPRHVVPCATYLSFAVVNTGVYYSPCGGRRDREQSGGYIQTWPPGSEIPIHVLDPSTGRVRVLASVKAPFEPRRLAVSPDGKTILIHRNTTISDLMLIENFR